MPFVRVVPNHKYLPIKLDCFNDPDNVISPGTNLAVQTLRADTQYRPVDEVQSLDPHKQSLALTEEPSLILQATILLLAHLSIDAKQNKPLSLVQSLEPHVHGLLLTVEPPLLIQGEPLAQRLSLE